MCIENCFRLVSEDVPKGCGCGAGLNAIADSQVWNGWMDRQKSQWTGDFLVGWSR